MPQCSACFILSIDDTIDSILDWYRTEGKIFKGGSGSGINLSPLRSSREHVTAGGLASGPVSFMRGADSVAGTIKSGGKTRRAAKMVVLNVDHPDIEEFVWSKAREEKKAYALGEAGYDMSLDGEAWISIQYQNANNSVRVTDDFMQAVAHEGRKWQTRYVTDGECRRGNGRARPDAPDRAGRLGVRGPGHAVPHDDQRLAHLPEHRADQRQQPLLRVHAHRRHACNLASINLLKFLDEDGNFDVEAYRAVSSRSASWRRRSSSGTPATRRRRSHRTRSTSASSGSASRTSARC